MDDNALTIAAFALGLVGTTFGILGAGFGIAWSIYTFVLQGPRPRCHLIYGGVFGNHGIIAPNLRQPLEPTVQELQRCRDMPMFDRLVVGVFVANIGRAPLYVDTIDIRAIPSGIRGHNAHLNFEENIKIPVVIPPGGRARLFAPIDLVRSHLERSERQVDAPQQAWFVMGIGAKEVFAGPIPREIIALGADPYPPVKQVD